ncbi:MAG: MotA/TolQ/ExbB proton channel family protein [Acidobacteriota bacterium]|nr:MotA/TolQ/ExbB proton channel family protein [Acidobacteriota bacterium]
MSRIRLRWRPLLASALLLAPCAGWAVGQSEFAGTRASVEKDLAASLRQLSELQARIAAEKLPLSRRLRSLESQLASREARLDERVRAVDKRRLELSNRQARLEARHAEETYLGNLLDEYVRNFETRVHITELQRFRPLIEAARNAPENQQLAADQVYARQLELVEARLTRLEEALAGTRFAGRAVAADGTVEDVDFALLGPIALFRTRDGAAAGLAEQQLGSLEPSMTIFGDPVLQAEAAKVVETGEGLLPLDPTLGNADKMKAAGDTPLEHIEKGGPVMVPMLLMAAAALLVALLKWFQLARIRNPSKKRVNSLLDAVRRRDLDGAMARLEAIPGPTGEMLRVGVEHAAEPRELVEEVMYEKMLDTRLRLQRFLWFIAICAAAAPLLGLLGTVTGIINTFKLITVYGTGDAKTLSSGISEALITTEFGLIVAIPSLLFHAYLSRRARRFVDGMEKTAISFVNRLSLASAGRDAAAAEQG